MATFGSRRGAVDSLNLPLMILAFLIVGGFLYWLSITAEGTEVQIVEEEPEEEVIPTSAIVAASDFFASPTNYEGDTIEVTGARVASRLGPKAFWVGPDDNPYLVKIDETLLNPPADTMAADTMGADTMAAEETEAEAPEEAQPADSVPADSVPAGPMVQTEDRVNIIGTVHLMNDSVLSAWDSLGVFRNEGDRLVAEFATSFLQALRVRQQPGRQQQGQGGGTGGEGEGGTGQDQSER